MTARTLVAVAPHARACALGGPRSDEAKDVYLIRELREALLDTYRTDAHLVAYVVEGHEAQPRIYKSAWETLGVPITVEVFFADIDTPDHKPWDLAFYDHLKTCMEELPILRHAGLYFTLNGARIVQPIDRRISVAEVERYVGAWVEQLIAAGLEREGVATVDLACRDWGRHFRLPNVKRRVDATWIDFVSPNPDYERMAPIEPPSPAPLAQVPRTIAKARPRREAPMRFAADVPAHWCNGVRILGDACARITDGRHGLYLVLSGALADKGAELEHLKPMCRAIAEAAGNDPNVRNRENCGETTAERIRRGDQIRGYGTLRMKWPKVAAALDVAAAWATAPPSLESVGTLEQAEAAMEEAIRAAPDGVTIVAAECGAGKSHAAVRVAIERASKPQNGTRAPLDSKTAISVPTHKLALQVVGDVRACGVKVRRHFSPASLRDEHGEPVCKKHEIALPLVQGGQSQHYELCQGRGIEPCEFLGACPAAQGWEGDEDARIIVGVHPLLPMLMREAGTTGLLVVDEPPPLPHSQSITIEDLEATERELASFDGIFAAALRPALSALWAWLRYCPSSTPVSLREAVQAQRWAERDDDLAWARAGTNETTEDLAELAQAAMSDEATRKGPPLKWEAVQMARASPQTAIRIGRASRVLHTLHFALTSSRAAKLYALDEEGQPPAAVIAHVYEPLQRALAREGRTAVLDANAAANLPLYTKALGYEPEMLTFAAPDGAPIERTLLRCSKATRTGWDVKADRFDVRSGSFQNALEAVIAWALEDPHATSLAIITMKPIREILEDCLRTDDDEIERQYKGRIRLMKAARERLAPILRRWRGELLWGHYGAVRGLNHMKDVDLLVTLGDPRPNVTATQNDLALLGLEDDAATRRVEALAQAELEQAQGRLRACRRTLPARALHVGTLKPGGTGWSGEVEFRELGPGRPRNVGAMHLIKLRAIVDQLGGVSHTARLIQIPRTTLNHYLKGEPEAPPDVVGRIQTAWRDALRKEHAK